MRNIDITKQDIRCCDEFYVDVEDEYIESTYELYFDVDKYFGTNTKNSDSCINLYTQWHPDGTITAMVFVDSDESCNEIPFDFTDDEKDFFHCKMEEQCIIREGMSLEEFWKLVCAQLAK